MEVKPACKPGFVRSFDYSMDATIIPLGQRLHAASSDTYPDLRVKRSCKCCKQHLRGPYSVLLQVGFSVPAMITHSCGALLPHRFTLTEKRLSTSVSAV
jgi:hypothetical protein